MPFEATKTGEATIGAEFHFQILDEGEYQDQDWHDDLKKILDS